MKCILPKVIPVALFHTAAQLFHFELRTGYVSRPTNDFSAPHLSPEATGEAAG